MDALPVEVVVVDNFVFLLVVVVVVAVAITSYLLIASCSCFTCAVLFRQSDFVWSTNGWTIFSRTLVGMSMSYNNHPKQKYGSK